MCLSSPLLASCCTAPGRNRAVLDDRLCLCWGRASELQEAGNLACKVSDHLGSVLKQTCHYSSVSSQHKAMCRICITYQYGLKQVLL